MKKSIRTCVHKLLKKADKNIEEASKGKFGFGVYKSESAKLLENRDYLRFMENKIKPKTCKLYFGTSKPLLLLGLFCDYYCVGIIKRYRKINFSKRWD